MHDTLDKVIDDETISLTITRGIDIEILYNFLRLEVPFGKVMELYYMLKKEIQDKGEV